MRRYYAVLLLACVSLTAKAGSERYLESEMTAQEYRALFARLEKEPQFRKRLAADPLRELLEIGKRNLDWIELINSKRDEAHKIRLTTPETVQAFPIESPRESNRTKISEEVTRVTLKMPKEMFNVLFDHAPLTDTITVSDDVFTTYALQVNRIYESASRWLLQEPDLQEYSQLAQYDIRGYYFLNKETDLINKLSHWFSLDETTRGKYQSWLVGECNNTEANINYCEKLLNQAITDKRVAQFHQQYVGNSLYVFNQYFRLQNPRTDIVWSHKNPDLMIMPFAMPARQDVADWLKKNVEDEMHMNDWQMQIDYRNDNNLARIKFEAGVTPHVNALGGNNIYMDANRNLNDYEVAWTIRHEFAHVLGLPDCYVEFYDVKREVMVNYQIDTTNLMCSRRGHFQARHYDELKMHYYKG